jgi:Spy/CpxP family protein refolding chaperone
MFRRIVIISTLAVALTGTAVMAQGLRGKAARRNALSGRGLDRIQERLNLTDAQLNGIRALQENRRKETESLRREIQPERRALRQLLRQPNPNPTDVGNATLALKQTRERRRDIDQRFVMGLKSLLTPDQLQKLPKRFQ